MDITRFMDISVDIGEEAQESSDEESSSVDSRSWRDPFGLQEAEMYEKIFEFLDVSDLLALSEVSKAFNYLIGHECEKTIDRYKLVIDETNHRRFAEIATSQLRPYRHLEIRALYDKSEEMQQLISHLSDYLVTIRTSYDVLLLDVALPHIKELFFFALNLEKSRIEFYESGLIAAAASNLESLILWGNSCNPDCFVKVLMQCSKLKKLILEQGAARYIFPEVDKYAEFPFQLHTLHCDSVKFNHQAQYKLEGTKINRNLIPYISFIRFVDTQFASLREIRFFGSVDLLNYVLNVLKFLERLTFSPLNDDNFSNHFYFENVHTSLKEANLILVSNPTAQNLIEKAPNLKKLYVAELDLQMLKFLTARADRLKELRFAYSYNHTLEEYKEHYELMIKNLSNNRVPLKISQI